MPKKKTAGVNEDIAGRSIDPAAGPAEFLIEGSKSRDYPSNLPDPDYIQQPLHAYRRTSDGISIEGSGWIENLLKVVDLLGYWAHKLAPYLIAAVVIIMIGAKGLPALLAAGGWNWMKRIMRW